MNRRAFIKEGTLFLAAAGLPGWAAAETDAVEAVKFAVVTDLHYADKPATGTRYYRETLTKLAEAAECFVKEKPAFVVELGDLIDAADSVEKEQKYLQRVNKEFSAIAKDRHYVLGNHCVDFLTKEEFLDGVERKASHYSFDAGGIHFVVLDACFTATGKAYGRKASKWNDANIPKEQIEWLQGDLKIAAKPTIVLSHQRLDVANDYGVKNAPEVRKALEASGHVRAVFQGHSHKNDHNLIAGIHYCTLHAMIEGSGVENNGYSMVTVKNDGSIQLTGFRKQTAYEWKGT
jgi:predicted phosphodiesterase